ncbi:hypothetical protein [Streptomyces flavidovirens]|uniref:hypothetical protein n=1 Tax=Streptomyces flavidovirens TaxID=67298 RepID=UPI003134240E
MDEGSLVVQRRRRYLDDEGVAALSTSWLPADLAQAASELISTGPLPKMTFGLIEDHTGRRPPSVETSCPFAPFLTTWHRSLRSSRDRRPSPWPITTGINTANRGARTGLHRRATRVGR